jgi:cbb3-type cytochrome oxidase subunit 1
VILNNTALPFTESTQTILAYLRGRSLSGMLLMAAHLIFAFHFGMMLFGLGRRRRCPRS